MSFCLKIIAGILLLLMGGFSLCSAGPLPSTPQQIYQQCVQDLNRCTRQHKPTRETYPDILDICWPTRTRCPQVCVEEYAARRKAGMNALDANPLYKGRSYEQASCIPGLDALKHPGRKLLPTDSKLDLSLVGPNGIKPIAAIISVTPLDESGTVAISKNNPRRQAHYETAPLHLPLPAGTYRILVVPSQDTALQEQTLIVKLKKAKSLHQTLTLLSSTPPDKQDNGTLRLLGASPGNPVYYSFLSGIDSQGNAIRQALPKNGQSRSNLDFSLPSGTYLLKIQPQNYAGGEQREVVSILPGKVKNLNIAFQQAGQLHLGIKGLSLGQKAGLNIWKPGNRKRPLLSINPQLPPLVARLAPGSYDVSLYIPSSEQVYGVERHLPLAPVVIQPGVTLTRQVKVADEPWGTLQLTTLLEGQPVAAHVVIRSVKRPDYEVYPVTHKYSSVKMPLNIRLLTGEYRLSVWGKEPQGKQSIYPPPGFEQKNVTLTIKEGETLSKTLKFTKKIPAELTLKVLLNGSAVKAGIKARIAGTNSPFSAVGSNYNLLTNRVLLLPGTYDFSIQPLSFTPTPGIDVFHGRSGSWVTTKKARGTKPMILHQIEIKPGSKTTKTLRFESNK